MYMSNEDYEYMDSIMNSLSARDMHDFLDILFELVKEQTGNDASSIRVLDGTLPDVNAIKPNEMVTRAMIEAAEQKAKEVRDAK